MHASNNYIELEPLLEICHAGHVYRLHVPGQFHRSVYSPFNPHPYQRIRYHLIQGSFACKYSHAITSNLAQYLFVTQTGACVLALGYANFLIIPCTNVFGRRPVALACALIVIGSNIWQALATSYSSFIGARVLIGIGAATSESLMPVTIADTLFLHGRGTWMGVYL